MLREDQTAKKSKPSGKAVGGIPNGKKVEAEWEGSRNENLNAPFYTTTVFLGLARSIIMKNQSHLNTRHSSKSPQAGVKIPPVPADEVAEEHSYNLVNGRDLDAGKKHFQKGDFVILCRYIDRGPLKFVSKKEIGAVLKDVMTQDAVGFFSCHSVQGVTTRVVQGSSDHTGPPRGTK